MSNFFFDKSFSISNNCQCFYDNNSAFSTDFSDLLICSQFCMVFRCSDSQVRSPGLISCQGQLPNRSDMKYQAYLYFRVHMVFMCRPSSLPNYLKYSSIWHQTKTIGCGIIFCMWENWSESKRMFKLYAL